MTDQYPKTLQCAKCKEGEFTLYAADNRTVIAHCQNCDDLTAITPGLIFKDISKQDAQDTSHELVRGED